MTTEYEVGAKVRIKPDAVDDYIADVARRVRNRVGYVSGHSYPSGFAIVAFDKEGRRKKYTLGTVSDQRLERVTD